MKNLSVFLILFSSFFILSTAASGQRTHYPQAQISNLKVVMKLYLPDAENGYYRATRFDWSGIIYSLEYKGHNYFGEWKPTHDPFIHEDLTGPVESFRGEGLGFKEAKPGEEFMRIGVGMLEKEKDSIYGWSHTYKILDSGKWKIEKGPDWIEFRHTLSSKAGWGYVYTKRIVLLKKKPGFAIEHTLSNTGQKVIDTDQFNHNFFVLDGEITGPDFRVEFPFTITSADGLKDKGEVAKIGEKQLSFNKTLTSGNVWMDLKGFGPEVADHQISIYNDRRKVGVQIRADKPSYRMVFWAAPTTLCPENFIILHIEPGESESWTSEYTLITD
jgi:hypothetical protein